MAVSGPLALGAALGVGGLLSSPAMKYTELSN
jgi:hypothetical protein